MCKYPNFYLENLAKTLSNEDLVVFLQLKIIEYVRQIRSNQLKILSY